MIKNPLATGFLTFFFLTSSRRAPKQLLPPFPPCDSFIFHASLCNVPLPHLHNTHMGLSVTPDVLGSHPPLMSLFAQPGLPLPPLTHKISYAQGNLYISKEPSSTWSLCEELQSCSILLLSFWLPCRNPWWPQDWVAALHRSLPPGCLLGQLMSLQP